MRMIINAKKQKAGFFHQNKNLADSYTIESSLLKLKEYENLMRKVDIEKNVMKIFKTQVLPTRYKGGLTTLLLATELFPDIVSFVRNKEFEEYQIRICSSFTELGTKCWIETLSVDGEYEWLQASEDFYHQMTINDFISKLYIYEMIDFSLFKKMVHNASQYDLTPS